MIHPATTLKRISEEVGDGVVATRFIPKGTIVWILCALDRVIPASEVDSWPAAYRKLVQHYCYADRAGNYVMCWDNGRNINHSCEPNMLSISWEADIAVRDIEAGEQLTCEYGAMDMERSLDCRCGTPSCREIVGNDDMILLGAERDRQAEHACRLMREVEQPLWPFLMNPGHVEEIARGLRKPTFHSLRVPALRTPA